MLLKDYYKKRGFRKTPEPRGKISKQQHSLHFVIQKHAARKLHYDLRLELDGVLKSWAVPKGPSLNPNDKHLAVQVEDHPLDYINFEGVIPEKEYGGGTIIVWDKGVWEPIGDAHSGIEKGKLHFKLEGEKVHGDWYLVRMSGEAGDDGKNWLLIKEKDKYSAQTNILDAMPYSILSGKSIEEIEGNQTYSSNTTIINHLVSQRLHSSEYSAKRIAQTIPVFIKPQLGTLLEKPPVGDQWLHEIKYDGYRALCRIEKKAVRLYSRNSNDWTSRFPAIVEEIASVGIANGWLDGEIVALLPDGRSSFQTLQTMLSEGNEHGLIYYLFDVIYLNDVDLRSVPLQERKKLLKAILDTTHNKLAHLRFSDHIVGLGEKFYTEVCKLALEGMVSKQKGHGYHSGRSRDWVKIKCLKRQEFVIGGFTKGKRVGFGALLLGVYDEEGQLVYCGRVGTGFNEKTLNDLRQHLASLVVDNSPFFKEVAAEHSKNIQWVQPKLVAEVAFSEWTRGGLLRQPSFQGLREDKAPEEVVRENYDKSHSTIKAITENYPALRTKGGRWEVAGVRISNPNKILYPDPGLTKYELALYYEAISEYMLPYLVKRPLTLLRCPEGYQAQCFFQKHIIEESASSEIRRIAVNHKSNKNEYLVVGSVTGVIALVQMGVLEIHTWSAQIDRLEYPDRVVFDLDPDEGLPWEKVLLAAMTLHARLADLGLQSFVKTTGGKGLHIVAPIVRRNNWSDVEQFAKAIAREFVNSDPLSYTASMSKAAMREKIYIDYVRNTKGSTISVNYSTRAKPGAPVSVPLRWDELSPKIHSDYYNVVNILERIKSLKKDPWQAYKSVQQSITKKMKKEVGID